MQSAGRDKTGTGDFSLNNKFTIIIGGGLSGLYAAKALEQRNEAFVLLEAKASFGGRIIGKPSLTNPDLAFDLGPTWFWPHQSKMQSLLTELNIEWFEQYTAGDVLYQTDAQTAPHRTYGAGTMPAYRVKGGMSKIIDKLLAKIPSAKLKAGHSVHKITRNGNRWQVYAKTPDTENLMIEGTKLMVALPPRILVKYLTPENWLSQGVVERLKNEQTWMSAQAKFIALYKDPFWRKAGLSGQVYSRVGPMVEIHDACGDINDNPAIFGFIGIPATQRVGISHKQMKQACLQQLIQVFGPQATDIEAAYLMDWSMDEYVATAKDLSEQPRHARYLIDKLKNELTAVNAYLIGSEFGQTDAGYLEGALSAVDSSIAICFPGISN
ncbi:FAD-dependent oxidoreductase [Thalassomonas viridans]|uniref:FAD-dependent oxidoreductase n=1 Tax=Thalassomonas viridans TaxID=137584 RepID=A0AAF0CDW9_9GAMM|nr:FAD-dependent oxidoreductase [Thalassomonas viridans]WDE08865.1 FAD-dependent oxidoreductase [Thalassomonas viridans]